MPWDCCGARQRLLGRVLRLSISGDGPDSDEALNQQVILQNIEALTDAGPANPARCSSTIRYSRSGPQGSASAQTKNQAVLLAAVRAVDPSKFEALPPVQPCTAGGRGWHSEAAAGKRALGHMPGSDDLFLIAPGEHGHRETANQRTLLRNIMALAEEFHADDDADVSLLYVGGPAGFLTANQRVLLVAVRKVCPSKFEEFLPPEPFPNSCVIS